MRLTSGWRDSQKMPTPRLVAWHTFSRVLTRPAWCMLTAAHWTISNYWVMIKASLRQLLSQGPCSIQHYIGWGLDPQVSWEKTQKVTETPMGTRCRRQHRPWTRPSSLWLQFTLTQGCQGYSKMRETNSSSPPLPSPFPLPFPLPPSSSPPPSFPFPFSPLP